MSLPGINTVTLPFTGPPSTASPSFETQLGPTGNPREVQAAAPLVVTSQELIAYAVAAGPAATLVARGPLTGGYVTNPSLGATQNIGGGTENLYISELVEPGATDALAFGPVDLLLPGQTWTFNSIPAGVSIYVNAPTGGHQFSGKFW